MPFAEFTGCFARGAGELAVEVRQVAVADAQRDLANRRGGGDQLPPGMIDADAIEKRDHTPARVAAEIPAQRHSAESDRLTQVVERQCFGIVIDN